MRKLLVLLAAGAFLVAYTVPAIAAEWDFGGNVMFRTFIEMDDKEAAGGFDDDDLLWGRDAGVSFSGKVQSGDIGGYVQWRPVESQVHSGDFSMLYGTWDFGGGVLTIGKAMGPANFFPSKQVWLDNQGLVGQGGIFTYFKPMIMGQFGNFKIALVEPQTTMQMIPIGGHPAFQVAVSNQWVYTQSANDSIRNPNAVECDTSIPKIEFSYAFDAGPVSLWVGGGYQTFDEVNIADKSYSIDSWIFGVGFKIPLGAAYVNGVVTSNKNAGQYQTEWFLQDDDARYNPVTDEIVDNDGFGYNIVVGFKSSDTLNWEIGHGHSENELDMPGSVEDDLDSYYIQANITVAEGFIITPEIGLMDWGKGMGTNGTTLTEQGETTYFGARWQIVF